MDDQQPTELIQAYLATESWEAAEAWLRATPEAAEPFVEALLELTDFARLQRPPDEAVYLGHHALLAARTKGSTRHQGMASLLLGTLTQHLGRLDDAHSLYAAAAALFSEAGDWAGLANTRKAQGDLARRLGQSEAAERYHQAATLFQQEQDELGLAGTLNSQAELAVLSGDPGGARALLEAAWARSEGEGQPAEAWVRARILTTWARSYLDEGDWAAAWDRANSAIKVVHEVAGLLPVAEQRAAALERAADAGAMAVAAALGCARQAEAAGRSGETSDWRLRAWQVAEEGRGQALLGLLGDQALRGLRRRPTEDDPETLQLLQELDQVTMGLQALLATVPVTGGAEADQSPTR